MLRWGTAGDGVVSLRRADLEASIGVYPAYSGEATNVSGLVQVSQLANGSLAVAYTLSGAQPGELEAELEAYPGYVGEWSNISGTVTVTESATAGGSGAVAVAYDLSGLPAGSLSAQMDAYPGYDGEYTVGGTVVVTRVNRTSIRVTYNLSSLEASKEGGMHIHTGSSCVEASEVGGHYFSPANGSDPWDMTTYSADSSGLAVGSFEISSGHPYDENTGHAFVVHLSNGTRAGCGTLEAAGYGLHIHEGLACDDAGGHYWTPASDPDPWAATLYYPDGEGNAEGVLEVDSGYAYLNNSGHALVVHSGSERIGCGVLAQVRYGMHIHEGTACEDAGGHYWTPASDPDPWNLDTSYYVPCGKGNAEGSFSIWSGYELEAALGHAFVIHGAQGERIGCGVLSGTTSPRPPAVPPPPPPSPPPVPPPPSPSPPPATPGFIEGSAILVSSVVAFEELNIASFDDESFRDDFTTSFKAAMAESASCHKDNVLVGDISSGSVLVNSTVRMETSSQQAGAAAFAATLESNVSSIFAGDSFSSYRGDIFI
ncbi:hypothetical protein CYMTET_10877 [Cymbomonas tetramitiformis]|uniref:Uncharacterized protein n=1 Tax=Cymbomonas tetramitiformis TaxID=36881 RepID=A0AAE0GNL5_9CHLO|nr:hypothetical protein CYMTET_10877 [Cymbomonas tetramitiformis]